MCRAIVFYFLVFFLALSSSVSSQVFWASKVISYSTQRDEVAYSAKQVLGPPSKLPALGDCGCAWTPSLANNTMDEFIRVGFDKKIRVKQILVSENFNAGTIKKIYLYDQYNIEHLVYERKDIKPEYGRLFSIIIPETEFETNDLKLILDTESVPNYNEIDAIAISDSEQPVEYKDILLTDKITFKGDAQKMGWGINTMGSEVTPLISPDGKTLYFTRKDSPENTGTIMNDDIWFTNQIGTKWTAPVNAGLPLNNDNNNYVIGISDNGNMLSLANTYSPAGISFAGVAQSWRRNDTTWRYPLNLVTPGMVTYNFYAEYYMNTDRSVLLVSLEKGGGFGLKDIYVSFTENQLIWTEPKNLGPVINSVANEMAPFLASDNKTLFFSSDGYPGYGDEDIYVSYRLDDTWERWTKPENLGPKVNSVGFDAYFTYSDSSYYAYFTSTRDNYFNPDIYRIPIKAIKESKDTIISGASISDEDGEITPVKSTPDIELTNDYLLFGTVFDSISNLPIDAQLTITLNDYESNPSAFSTLNHNYRMKITGNVSYKVVVQKEGYLYHEEIVTIKDLSEKKVKRVDFKLIPIQKGEKFILNNMYFDANSAVIKPESFEQLNTLYDFMIKNPGVKIEIGGHTNGLCDDDFCKTLSQQRANAVMVYLKNKGIETDRLSAVGYGKKQPITLNDTPDGRKKNQRVEVTIR